MAIDKFYTSNPENERMYLAFIVSHSLLSQTYYFVDDTEDLTVTDPDVVGGVYTKEGISYTESISADTLDKTADLSINDFGDIIDTELDRIPLDNEELIVITVNKYHSSDLSITQESTSFRVKQITQDTGIAQFSLEKPRLNVKGSGVIMSYARFPMQRGI